MLGLASAADLLGYAGMSIAVWLAGGLAARLGQCCLQLNKGI